MLLCALVRRREGTERPSPLAAIEARVQARAKDLALDVTGAAGAARLRALIDEEVARWRADHRRGLHEVDVVDAGGVADRAFRNLAGYGPLEPLLADPEEKRHGRSRDDLVGGRSEAPLIPVQSDGSQHREAAGYFEPPESLAT